MSAYWITEQADLDRFWSKVDRSAGIDSCWTWTASRTPGGYGSFRGPGGRRSGRLLKAHRLAYVLGQGRPIDLKVSDQVCHHCDNPPCCNPAHLYLGDIATNTADRMSRGRQSRGKSHGDAVRVNSDKGDRHWTRRMPERLATRKPRSR